MGYRDQLEAARARVSNLQEQVAELEREVATYKGVAVQRAKGRVSSSALSLRREIGKLKKESRKRIDELDKQLDELDKQLSEKQQEEDKWRKRCGELEQVLGGASLPSLIDHNRSRPVLDIGGYDAPAQCPQCLQRGERVMLRHAPVPLSSELATELEGVLCPRCAYFGLLRT